MKHFAQLHQSLHTKKIIISSQFEWRQCLLNSGCVSELGKSVYYDIKYKRDSQKLLIMKQTCNREYFLLKCS